MRHVFPLQQHELRWWWHLEQMSVEMVELSVKAAEPLRPAGNLQQNRVFLDFFWDLAKPDQEVRLKAVENLIQYLKTNNKVRQTAIGVTERRSVVPLHMYSSEVFH